MLTAAPIVTPIVLPDETIEQLGDVYLALPAGFRLRISFERFLVYRNGALFEKLRHHRQHRRGASALRWKNC